MSYPIAICNNPLFSVTLLTTQQYRRILLTKVLPKESVKRLYKAAFEVVMVDFIEIIPKAFHLHQDELTQEGILSSPNAIASLTSSPYWEQLKVMKWWVVGERSAELLRDLGVTVLGVANTAAALIPLIDRKNSVSKLTYFCGNLRRPEMRDSLEQIGIVVKEKIVYETVLRPRKLDGSWDTIMFFSPSGVRAFLSNNSLHEAHTIAIGPTTAEALNGYTDKIYVSETPNLEQMIDLTLQIASKI